jgi:hypothetical protein
VGFSEMKFAHEYLSAVREALAGMRRSRFKRPQTLLLIPLSQGELFVLLGPAILRCSHRKSFIARVGWRQFILFSIRGQALSATRREVIC